MQIKANYSKSGTNPGSRNKIRLPGLLYPFQSECHGTGTSAFVLQALFCKTEQGINKSADFPALFRCISEFSLPILESEVMIVSKQSVYFHVPGLDGKHPVKKIKQALDELPGVFSVSANTEEDQVAVDYDDSGIPLSAIKNQLAGIGINAQLIDHQGHTLQR